MNKKNKIVIILIYIIIIIFYLLKSRSQRILSNTKFDKIHQQLLTVYQNYCACCHGMPDVGNELISEENYSIEEINNGFNLS